MNLNNIQSKLFLLSISPRRTFSLDSFFFVSLPGREIQVRIIVLCLRIIYSMFIIFIHRLSYEFFFSFCSPIFNKRQMMENIMESIKSKTIHIPSVFRLLRLLHATMCEMGEECCAYDLEKYQPSPLLSIYRRSVHDRPFGLALCSTCVEALSGRVVFEASNQQAYDQQEQIVEQIETHPQGTLSTRLLCATHVERVTNENVGSLVLYKHVQRIESSYTAASDGAEKRKLLLEDLIVQKQNGITEKDKMLSQVYVTAFDFAMEHV